MAYNIYMRGSSAVVPTHQANASWHWKHARTLNQARTFRSLYFQFFQLLFVVLGSALILVGLNSCVVVGIGAVQCLLVALTY